MAGAQREGPWIWANRPLDKGAKERQIVGGLEDGHSPR